jgi:hypothetical protein
MRRVLALGVLLGSVMLAACSSSEPMAFELAIPDEYGGNPPNQAFAITGDLADEGEVCDGGEFAYQRWEDMDGTLVESWTLDSRFEAAVESGGVFELQALKEFVCADGTGTLNIEEHLYLDFSDPALAETASSEAVPTGRIKQGTFVITGTDHYAELNGSGDVYGDWDTGQIVYAGEAQHGQ